MNKTNITLALAVLLSLSVCSFAQNKPAKKAGPIPVHKVVMQLTTGDTLEHKGLLKNLMNLKEGWGDSVQIEVVIHGPGIDLVTKGKATQEREIQKMIEKGVFISCLA